jgi:hypothetical protein
VTASLAEAFANAKRKPFPKLELKAKAATPAPKAPEPPA